MHTSHRFGVARTSTWLIGAVALAALAAGIFLLHAPRTDAAPASSTLVSTAQTGLGRILVNSRGHTLYLFSRDRNGKSTCSGQCATFWPPLIASGKPRVAGGAKASLIGTIKRADGRRQVTYNHHRSTPSSRTRRRASFTARA